MQPTLIILLLTGRISPGKVALIMNGFKFYEAMSRGKSECNRIPCEIAFAMLPSFWYVTKLTKFLSV